MRKPTKERWPNTLNYKNSAEVVVGIPGCFPWRYDTGYQTQSVWRMLGKLGIKAGDRKRAVGRLGQASEKVAN